ncbi:PLxRFG domain-containing protein [Neoaquamicrobium sediminum]|uniref:PLxRFG domain-containing protein n=1 Tax=Neoaquamicrobium sediminum TaxID=1849104 RepID=UPI003BAC9FEF
MLKVMSDARKAALDMRLIDPSYGDKPGSKVHVAADNIKRIYDGWNAQKGTQLVFIDLSTPKKAKAREEARLRDLLRKADEGDEAAQEALDKMSPDEFMALDSKFSVYDDLKQKLVDRGIPEGEIAFIHDANTDLQKEELFGKVRAGRVRVLFGSTPKMGAGTNVQARLVALHHLDAPWRPSDLEQRDGRGIRQGNTLYEQDPGGFEIEILRYATRNTLDARQWQTIEGKARFIQQMRKGGVKSREIEDIAGEAANAAEMKAAASGNPLILEEMDLRQKLRRLEGQESEHDRWQHRIRGRIRSLREEKDRIDDRADTAEADAASAAELAKADFAATVEGVRHEKNKDFGAAIIAVGRRMLKEGGGETALGSYGPFQLRLEYAYDKAFSVEIAGADTYNVHIADVDEKDPVGLSQQIVNTVRKLADVPDQLSERVAEIDRQVPALEKQVGPWADAGPLEETRARHREVLDQLRPKPKTAGTVEAPADAEASLPRDPVARLTGDELGVAFQGREDMPALRRAATRWFDENLRGTTATMADGQTVRFNRKGMGKSTSNSKGDLLLRSVPAIRAIIERGTVVHREPGNRHGITERLVIAAPVEILGKVHGFAVSVHQTADGRFQYDFTFDRDAGRPGFDGPGGLTTEESRRSAEEGAPGSDDAKPRVDRGGPDDRVPSLEVPVRRADEINIVEWPLAGKETRAGWDIAGGETDTRSLGLDERQEIARIIQDVARLDDVRFADRIVLPNGAPGWGTTSPTTAGGFYSPSQDVIVIALDSGTNGTAYHEAFHRLQRFFLTPKERGVLRAEIGRLRRIVRSDPSRRDQVGGMSIKEIEAEAFAIYAAGVRDANGRRTPVVHKTLAAAWNRLAEMASRIRNYLGGRGFQTAEDVFAAAKAGEMGRRALLTDTAAGSVEPSIAPATAAPLVRSPDEIVRTLKGKATDWAPALLGTVPLNYFTELKRPNMTAIDDYLKIKRSMDAYRGKKHSTMDQIAQEWRKFARLGWGPLSKQGKARAAQLAELMHEATLAGVDPASNDPEVTKQPAYAGLRKRYMALPPAGRDLYNKVRDTYRQQAEETDKILLDNVRKAQKIADDRAEAQFLEELDRIDRARMQPSAKKMAIEDAKRAHAAARTKAQWSMKARLTRLRIAFEASRVQPPYFPLARFGRYYALVRDVDGGVLSFSKREKAADRDRLAAELRRAYPTAKIEVGVMDENEKAREAMDPRMVAEIETLVGGAGIDPSTTAALLDSIWQRYLETMPDLSARKRFIHRKGTAGFDVDAMRAFAHHMFHAAHQTARLTYGLELQENLNRSVDQARKSDDPTRGVTLTNELKKRHDWVMNPTSAKWSTTINSISFAWMLGATPAAAIINMTQTPMLGIPILGARLGGMAKASAALAKASFDSVAGRGSVTRANLTHDERRALDAFYDSGLIDRSQAHDLAGVGETGVEYSPIRARIMAVIALMYHHAEVWNREVTALAAYRMAKAQGQNETQAIDTAHDLTWKVHFDYSNASRARYLQGDVGKALFVFQSHTLNMTYRMVRDTHQALKGETKQARREARYQLAGILGMMSFLAGGTGVFGYSMVMTLLSAFFGDDDDPMDFEQSVRKAVLEQLGPDVGGIVLKGVPGHLLGIDLTPRLGMPYLWLRPETRELEGRAEFEQLVIRMLGANVGMMANWWHGASIVLKDGQTARGVEMGAPKALKDAMKSFRYLNEGLTSLRGDEVLPREGLSGWDAIAQAVGFTPARVSETYERNSALKTAEIRVMNRRRELVNRFAMAHRLGDREARDEAMEAIKRFNKVPINRPVAITTETLRRSLAARDRNARRREDGVLIQNERLGRDLREKLPEPVYR